MEVSCESIEGLKGHITTLHRSISSFLPTIAQPLSLSSWKYPEKKAVDVDITGLLDLYTYRENDQAKNQIIQVSLLEVVIDRLFLLLDVTQHLLGKEDEEENTTPGNALIESYSMQIAKTVARNSNKSSSKDDIPCSSVCTQSHLEEAADKEVTQKGSPLVHLVDNAETSVPQTPGSEPQAAISEPQTAVSDSQTAISDSQTAVSSGIVSDPSGPKLRNRENIRNPLQDAAGDLPQVEDVAATVKYDRRRGCPTCGHKAVKKTKPKKYQCPKCHKWFSLIKQVAIHNRRVHGVAKTDQTLAGSSSSDKLSDSVDEGDHQCRVCMKRFKDDKQMLRHFQTRHRGSEQDATTKKKTKKVTPEADGRFKCEECEKSFKTERILRKHMQIHTGDYTYNCELCGKGYYNIGSYRAHLSTHTGEKYFTCKQCGKGFPHSSSYNFHIRTAHVTEQNFECTICNRKYKSAKYLKDHMQSVHLQPDRYNCTTCGRTFGHRASLFMHVKTHRKDSTEAGQSKVVKKESSSKSSNIKASAANQVSSPSVEVLVRDYNVPIIKQIKNYPNDTPSPDQNSPALHVFPDQVSVQHNGVYNPTFANYDHAAPILSKVLVNDHVSMYPPAVTMTGTMEQQLQQHERSVHPSYVLAAAPPPGNATYNATVTSQSQLQHQQMHAPTTIPVYQFPWTPRGADPAINATGTSRTATSQPPIVTASPINSSSSTALPNIPYNFAPIPSATEFTHNAMPVYSLSQHAPVQQNVVATNPSTSNAATSS